MRIWQDYTNGKWYVTDNFRQLWELRELETPSLPFEIILLEREARTQSYDDGIANPVTCKCGQKIAHGPSGSPDACPFERF